MNKNLAIIGNGFDIAHKLPTSYPDFWDYICNQQTSTIVDDKYELINRNIKKDLLWSNIELALGKIFLKEAQEMCHNFACNCIEYSLSQHPNRVGRDFNDVIKQINQKPSTQDIELKQLYALLSFDMNLKHDLQQWISYIENEKIKECTSISHISEILKNCDNILTFNYTSVCENIYHCSANICHIHGSLAQENLIIGHGNKKKVNFNLKRYTDKCGNNKKSNWFCQNYMLRTYKDTNRIHKNNKKFFNKLYDTNVIYILGHSLSKVDDLYFKEINRVSPKANWIIYQYIASKTDKQHAYKRCNKFLKRIGISKRRCKIIFHKGTFQEI